MERQRWEGLVTVPRGRTFAPLQGNHKRDVSGGPAGTRASGVEASLLQVNHKKDVNGGQAGTQASGAEASFQAEGTVSVKALSPVGPWLLPTPQVAGGYMK